MRGVLLVLLSACSGMTGAVGHARNEVTWEHCKTHDCSTPPVVQARGDGCYNVGDEDYECSFDDQADKQVHCHSAMPRAFVAAVRWVQPSSDLATYVQPTTFGSRRRQDGFGFTGKCWRFDCGVRFVSQDITIPSCPARLAITDSTTEPPANPGIAFADLGVDVPATLAIPEVTRIDIMRSGKTAVIAALELCVSPDGILDPWTQRRSSGFHGLDDVIRRALGQLRATTPPAEPACATVTVILRFPDSCG
ncbi:MAG: hypothetical protein ABI867_20290 [Kofleriaceae bacterium]